MTDFSYLVTTLSRELFIEKKPGVTFQLVIGYFYRLCPGNVGRILSKYENRIRLTAYPSPVSMTATSTVNERRAGYYPINTEITIISADAFINQVQFIKAAEEI